MAESPSRPLTKGEIALAESVFGEAIDYSKVQLVRGKWWPLQPRNAAMAPNGNIYFHPHAGGWSEDFANEPLSRQGFFIHEMTHVWQAQKGGRFYLPLMRHPFCRYRYRLVPGKPFRRYGLEQQAEIVRHLFLADRGGPVAAAPPADLLPFPRRHGNVQPPRALTLLMADRDDNFGIAGAARKRTDWAEDRTVLANERTFGSWLRTGFGAIGIALGFHALFGRIHPLWVPRAVATAFLAIAVIIFVAAERRSCTVIRRLHTHEVETVKIGVLRLITGITVAATVALTAALWLLTG